jgi:hypothetical protein
VLVAVRMISAPSVLGGHWKSELHNGSPAVVAILPSQNEALFPRGGGEDCEDSEAGRRVKRCSGRVSFSVIPILSNDLGKTRLRDPKPDSKGRRSHLREFTEGGLLSYLCIQFQSGARWKKAGFRILTKGNSKIRLRSY